MEAIYLTISIEQFEFHQDNLGFLLHDNETGATAAIPEQQLQSMPVMKIKPEKF